MHLVGDKHVESSARALLTWRNKKRFCTFEHVCLQVKGIIYPPPDIRAIVDKTARVVAKHGKSFEERIQASEEGKSAMFNFMRPHDPYYAYYEFKIRDFEENGDAPKPVRVQIPRNCFFQHPVRRLVEAGNGGLA